MDLVLCLDATGTNTKKLFLSELVDPFIMAKFVARLLDLVLI